MIVICDVLFPVKQVTKKFHSICCSCAWDEKARQSQKDKVKVRKVFHDQQKEKIKDLKHFGFELEHKGNYFRKNAKFFMLVLTSLCQ